MEQYSFGYWLRLRRKALDLTRDGLADRVGYSAETIRKIETEQRRPSAEMAERLAEILNIPQDERTAFLRFARGDWRAAPTGNLENAPWLASQLSSQNASSDSQIHLATFLFTDIEASAKLWEIAPEKMKVALQRHHEILEQAITADQGSVFQIVGDAFCAAFLTVQSAISAAVTAQRELHQEEWDTPSPIRVRMGIHTGEAERSSNPSILGGYASNQTLNRVARILSAAHGGQVLLSLATKDLVKDSLPANTKLRDMGEHHLRNLMYPEHLFQLNIAGLPSEFPPLNTLTHRHNLPVQLTSFIAREQEIALVHQYLQNDNIRLVTLIGPPGIGKTRLSIEAARAALQDFSEGVFFVALAPLDDPNLIAAAIAQALGYVGAKNISTTEQLREGIADKKLLLVFDNCEHLIEAVALLAADLLSACSQLKILATSRESLRIPGEWLYAVPAFDLPTERASLDVESASQYPALTLFAERARAVRSDFSLNAENVETIAEICARLDGLPLVIELIAARIRMMTPQTLLARLTSQFVLTADGMRAASERQKTLHNAIDWSYQLLPPEEQKLFAYLSIFSGGFTLEAVEANFSQKLTEKPLPTLIALLLDKSLIKFPLDRESSDETRYTMLVTIQEYARERLQEMGEGTEVRNAHLAYFLALAEQADREIHGPDQVIWLDRLEAEHDNFRAVLDWCVTNQYTEAALGLSAALGWTWLVRGYYSEVLSWFDKLCTLPNIKVYPLAYAKLLHYIGYIYSEVLSDFSKAQSILEESRAIWLTLETNGEQGLAEALNYLGMVIYWSDPNSDHAQSLFEQSFRLYQKHANQRGIAESMFLLGIIASDQNNRALALSLFEQSLDLYRHLGDVWGIGRLSELLGREFFQLGNYEKARQFFEEHLSIDEKLKARQGMVIALRNLGTLYRYQGDFDQADQYYGRSLLIGHEYGMKSEMAYSLLLRGLLALHRNDYLLARQQFTTSLDLSKMAYNEIVSAAKLLNGLAAVKAGTNQPQRAAKLYGAAQGAIEMTESRIPAFDQTEFDRHIQIAREQLSETLFETLAAEGRAMTMEQAIAYAVEQSND